MTSVSSERSRLIAAALQSRDVIELLSDKWRIAIILLLERGFLRTGQLQSAIQEISPKMLTQTLRGMERDGLIIRTVRPVAPPHVEYRLTKMGLSIIGPVREMCRWARKHIAERDAARARYDLAAKSGSAPGHPSATKYRR